MVQDHCSDARAMELFVLIVAAFHDLITTLMRRNSLVINVRLIITVDPGLALIGGRWL